jgi:hypothetical protein
LTVFEDGFSKADFLRTQLTNVREQIERGDISSPMAIERLLVALLAILPDPAEAAEV